MHPSFNSARKSKYQTSSRKVNELFEQFQQLKQRIKLPKPTGNQNNLSFRVPSPNSKANSKHSSLHLHEQQNTYRQPIYKHSEFSKIQMIMKSTIESSLSQIMVNFDQKVNKKLQIMENRLLNLNEAVSKLYSVEAIKNPRQNGCPMKKVQSQQNIKELQQKHKKQMKQMVSSYEEKISLLLRQKSSNQTSDSKIKISSINALKESIKRKDDEILLKDTEITEEKLQNLRVKKSVDQLNQLIKAKDKLIKELTIELQDKNKHQNQLEDALINKENQLSKLKESSKRMEQWFSGNNQMKKNECQISTNKSLKLEDEDQNLLEASDEIVSIDPLDNHQRKSQIIESKNKKSLTHLQKIKELKTELELLDQENIWLVKSKQILQNQVKQNEEDEQKFQMQSHILRQEIKRVGSTLRNLDECAVKIMNGNKLPFDKINELGDQLEFKKEYNRRYGHQRSSSKNSKLK